jgi:capsular exopolysaccharide synthesis family protein
MNTYETSFKQNIDYKKIFRRFLEFKRLYIFAIVLFLIAAFIYNRTAKVMYQNSTTILITEKNQNLLNAGQGFMQGMAFMTGKANIDNEIEVLGSFSLIKNAIQRMDSKASIFSYEKSLVSDLLWNTSLVKKTELYDASPIRIIIDPTQPQPTYLNFFIEIINDNTFRIKTKGNGIYLYNYIDDIATEEINNVFFENTYKFGEDIKTKYFNFQVVKSQNFDKNFTNKHKLFFYLNNTNSQTFEYIGHLKIENATPLASILKITLKGGNYYRVTDFLNSLVSVFLDRNLEKKNNTASSTISFIDAQISEFKDSLSSAEVNLKNFRTSNQVMDLSFQGQQVYSKLEQLETEKSTLQAQQRYYSYLSDYFKNNRDFSGLVSPSSMNVVDPILTNLVSELISLNSEKASITRNNTNSDNILLKDLNFRIDNLKNALSENVNNSVKTISISISEIEYRIAKLTSQISTMPKTELQLKGIERKFELNSTIYTFLLQKRSEAQIAKASSMPDFEVVEPAHAISQVPISPQRRLNLLIALFMGMFIPTCYVLIIDFFNNRLNDINEIEALSKNPVLGKVFHNYRKASLIVAQRPNSSVAESFRSIRTNFQFFDPSGKKQVVLITSSASGDGKTFCSINFATVLALNGHKTVIIEFDLRRPKIHKIFGSSNMIGISSYLIDKAVIDDIIVPTEVENLDLISAGPAAPNPAELIASERTSEFIETLKGMYDYIVIDSAPVGVVSETYLLMKYSDVNIFVVRLDFTVKEAFKNALKGLQNNGFDNYSLLINDINIHRETVKYGYDAKYYTDNEAGFFKRLFSRNKSA